ncbi:hypothetical protein GCM10010398_61020 [Streptomyces fimbriatus]
MFAAGRGHGNRASWQLGVAKPTEIQETLLPQLYVLAPVEFDSAAPSCDCVAHRFGNAADHPERVRRYPSDMTDAEWAVVRSLPPVPGRLRSRGGQPEAYCHRAMPDAVRHLVDNGIKWRAMPCDFPPWDRVCAFFRRWRDHGLVQEFHDRLRGRGREKAGRDAEPTAGVIDSQSVKADAIVDAGSRGFDGGKLINGRKRHVVVDTLGLLLAVMVTAADIGDRAAAKALLGQVADAHHRLELVRADGGYTGSLVEHCLAAFALVLARAEPPRRTLARPTAQAPTLAGPAIAGAYPRLPPWATVSPLPCGAPGAAPSGRAPGGPGRNAEGQGPRSAAREAGTGSPTPPPCPQRPDPDPAPGPATPRHTARHSHTQQRDSA